MKSISITLALLALNIHLFAQSGDFFISHFKPTENIDAGANFDLVQRPDGLIAIANRGGILLFDGKNWDMHPSKGTPLCFAAGKDGIYAGGAYGVGFQSFKNPEEFKILHPDTGVHNIFNIAIAGARLLAIEDKKLHVFSLKDRSHTYTIAFPEGYLQKIVPVGDQAIISTTKGNFVLEENHLEFAENIPTDNLITSFSFNNKNLVITASGSFFEVDGSQWRELNINFNEYEETLDGVEFIDAAKIEDRVAITTSNSGIVVIDLVDYKVERLINYHNGLPDNEIYFIASDNSGGLWVGHEQGLSRIAPYLPIQNFSNFPGLSGNLITTSHIRNTLFVGTSTGLYRLEEVKNFKEVVNYIKKEKITALSEEPEQSKTKGIFSFLRRRKEEPQQNVQEKKITEVTYEKQVSKELKSIKHLYKKVDGIDGKVNQLISTGDELFAASLDGLYRINNNNKGESLSSEAIKLVWLNNAQNFLIANTYDGHILTFRKAASNKWEETFYFEGYKDILLDIYEDDHSRIWFASPDQFYYITYDENDIYAGGEFEYKNLYLDPIFINQDENGNITFTNRNGRWVYEEISKTVKNLEAPEDIDHFIKGGNGIWLNKNGRWTLMGDNSENKFLNSLKDITFLTSDSNGNVYAITALNTLYKVPNNVNEVNGRNKTPLLLKSITENGESLQHENVLRFVQRQSDLSFEFIQPEFTGLSEVEYQYRVKGLSKEWSDWSADNNKINFNYLPEGNYMLEIKSKTALGEVISMDPLFFQVVLPYWKRPWFYAFEFTVLGMLLLLTIHLNNNAPRYRILNKLLAFLTLIMIIEFIQVTAESNIETDFSPIGGFFIQVVIAFIVLPVEGFLRKLILRNKKFKVPMFLKLYRNK